MILFILPVCSYSRIVDPRKKLNVTVLSNHLTQMAELSGNLSVASTSFHLPFSKYCFVNGVHFQ